MYQHVKALAAKPANLSSMHKTHMWTGVYVYTHTLTHT